MTKATIVFAALLAGAYGCYRFLRFTAKLEGPWVRTALRALLISLVIAPVPVFGHGVILLPNFIVIFLLGLELLDSAFTRQSWQIAGWAAIGVAVWWPVFIFTGKAWNWLTSSPKQNVLENGKNS